jgi:hypothetical protein
VIALTSSGAAFGWIDRGFEGLCPAIAALFK